MDDLALDGSGMFWFWFWSTACAGAQLEASTGFSVVSPEDG